MGFHQVHQRRAAGNEGGLRVGYKWDNYEVAAFARNITDRVQTVAAIDFDNLTGMVNEPRTLGVQLKATF